MQSSAVRTSRVRTAAAVIVSVVAHLLVFCLLFVWAPRVEKPVTREKVSLNIVDRATKQEFDAAPLVGGTRPSEDSDVLDGQVVSLPEPAVQQAPESSRFLSRYDTRVEKEQVSRRRPGAPGKKSLKVSGGGRSLSSKSEGTEQAVSELTEPAPLNRTADPDEKKVTLPSIRGLGNMLLPGGAAGGRGSSLNMRMLADQVLADGSMTSGGGGLASSGQGGEGGSDDVFMGVEDEGDVTLVNSRSFKYWDFFDRIKGQVRSEWDPGPVYRARDPDGNAFGKRDRYTILGVVLDGKGAVAQLDVVHRSGLDFLDEEAIRAFQSAAPFPNPPAGLIDERGRIVFRFGFLLEFGSRTGSFFWERP